MGKTAPQQYLIVDSRQGEHVGAEQLFDRVDVQERRQQTPDRRDVVTDGGLRAGNALAGRAAEKRRGQRGREPRVITVKKNPVERTDAEFWKVSSIAPPAPRRVAGREFMTAEEFGAANRPIDSPTSNSNSNSNDANSE